MSPPSGSWAPVVYGRTRTADSWWRVVPTDVDRHGWLGRVVHAVLYDGLDLAGRPRFLLARDTNAVVLGVACRAAEISPDMNSDGQRPLFCLVGWHRRIRPNELPALPTDRDLTARWVAWAGELYERSVRPDWDAHASRLRDPHLAEAALSPPWSPNPTTGVDAGELPTVPLVLPAPLVPSPAGRVELHPTGERATVWAAATVTVQSFCLTTGWAQAHDALATNTTHACADDVERVQLAPSRVPLARRGRPSDPGPPTRAGRPSKRQESHDVVQQASPAAAPAREPPQELPRHATKRIARLRGAIADALPRRGEHRTSPMALDPEQPERTKSSEPNSADLKREMAPHHLETGPIPPLDERPSIDLQELTNEFDDGFDEFDR